MTAFNSEPVVLHADQDHIGIRVLVILSLVLALALGFLLLSMIAREVAPESEFAGIISCFGAIPLALGAVLLAERGLKRVWPSGRFLRLDGSGIQVNARGGIEQQFSWNEHLTQLKWFFKLKGYQLGGPERRVPKQWLCFACQLQQDEHQLVVFSFFSRKDAEALLGGNQPDSRFHQIHPDDVRQGSFKSRLGPPARPDIPASVLAGSDGRFWLAERRRWHDGFELSGKDFRTFLQIVQNA